jgi:hypothetical protein
MALTYSRDPVARVVQITYAANPRFEGELPVKLGVFTDMDEARE